MLDKVFGTETPPPRLTEERVLEIARATGEKEGWPCIEPVLVSFTPGDRRNAGVWSVWTAASGKGGNINIHVSDETGA
ncbi:MAG: hypothetical protein ACRDHF_15580, partial [Tepidiformaceae bacterium]